MNTELLSNTISIVFSGHLLYLAPFLFLLMTIAFSDNFIGLLFTALENRRKRRNY